MAGTKVTVMTEEKAMQHMLLTGTATEKRYMESKWWTKMPRVEQRKSRYAARAV